MHSPEPQIAASLEGSIIAFDESPSLLLTEMLGSGTYGAVYYATPSCGSLVSVCSSHARAVKVLLRPASGTHRSRKLLEEFDHHRRVSSHPNILTLHECVFDLYYIFSSLDYVSGGDLHDALANKAVSWQDDDFVRCAIRQIVDAVAFCHEQGIAHRDIKPGNILCSANYEHLYLSDFGMATDERYSGEFMIGTLRYNAPELNVHDPKRGDLYETRKVDVWALGCVLVSMLGCTPPWSVANQDDIAYVGFLESPEYLCTVQPISREANDLVRRVLEPMPSRRIALGALRTEIESVQTFFTDAGELDCAPERVRSVSYNAACANRHWQKGFWRYDSVHYASASKSRIGSQEVLEPVDQHIPPPATSSEGEFVSSSLNYSSLAGLCSDNGGGEDVPLGALEASSPSCAGLASLCGSDEDEDDREISEFVQQHMSGFLTDNLLEGASHPSSPSWTESTPRALHGQFTMPRAVQAEFVTPRPLQRCFAVPGLSHLTSPTESTLALCTPPDSPRVVAIECLPLTQQNSASEADSCAVVSRPASVAVAHGFAGISLRGLRRAAASSAARVQAALRRRRRTADEAQAGTRTQEE